MKKLKTRVNRKTVFPDKGEIVQIVSLKNITPFDYIFNSAKIGVIDELTFIQLAGSAGQYKTLNSIIDKGKVSRVNFYMSDFIIKMSAGTLTAINEIVDKTGGEVKFYTNHVKYTLMKQGENYYVVNSTANAASDTKIEYMEIHNNKEYYNYLLKFCNKYFE